MAPATTIQISSGVSIPAIAYGSGTAWYKRSSSDPLNRTLVDATKEAIKVGYRFLDTAEIYNTEAEVGQAIKESVEEGVVKREELVVATKILAHVADPEKALKSSLAKLQLPYVDIYYLHAPFLPENISLRSVWTTLESLQKQGLTKHIAVSNFNVAQLEELLSFATIPPVLNQIEFNPYCNDTALLQFCKEKKIVVAAYSPLSPITKFPGGSVDAPVNEIAEKKGWQKAQVLLRWVVEQGVVAVTTTGKRERLEAFLEVGGLRLEADEVERIKSEGGKEKHRIYWTDKYKD
ncbi:Aldo/keto reductase [Ascodesmis nigricans]|uniref:Aldo/keto reductase n=1 Tax=Ascodesmis nigricans TaxID=341454 RepID=A0A4S2ML37_9PEZI|nr:Aldo/keto reductase [Ascodesmis nigricans]